MIVHQLALLTGLFVIPAWLTWQGHRLRHRSARGRALFWGVVAGHTVAMIVLMVVIVTPSSPWSEGSMREYGVYWLLTAGSLLGALAAGLKRMQ